MSYTNPGQDDDDTPFSIGRRKIVFAEQDETLLLFDLPIGTVVMVNGVEVPGKVFDYYNPLVLSPNNRRVRFYDGESLEPLTSIVCYQLTVSDPELIEYVRDRTIHYAPLYDINWATTNVSLSSNGRSISAIFEEDERIREADPFTLMMRAAQEVVSQIEW